MKNQPFCTYKITNTLNGKQYFGWTNKSPERRFKIHVWKALVRKDTTILHNSIRKHGPNAFIVELVGTHANRHQALKGEQQLIIEYKTNHCRYPNNGYNMTDGGEGTSGMSRTINQTEAARQHMTNYNHSTKGLSYKERYGDRADKEKQKRIAALQQPATDNTRQKMAESKKGNKNGCFPVRVTHDDGHVEVFSSQNEALDGLGIKTRTTLRSIATGKRWRNGEWQYYNNPYPFTIEFLRTKLDE